MGTLQVHQIPGKYFQSLERVLQRPEGALILTLSVPTLKEVRPDVGFRVQGPQQGGCPADTTRLRGAAAVVPAASISFIWVPT